MKQVRLTKITESRRSQDGHVEVRAETADGESVQINFAPDASERMLWSILSTKGKTYANEWKLWPLSPDHLTRALHSDGTMELTFVQGQLAAFPVRIEPPLREVLLEALSKPPSGRSTDPSKAH